jgi:CHAT domain-containing protein/Tfp pilus assembly protein PilF
MPHRRAPGLLTILIAFLALACCFAPAFAEAPPLERATVLVERIRQLSKEGKQAEALPLAHEVLAILEAETAPDSPALAAFLCTTAGLYDALERYDEAVPLYERALPMKEKLLGASHPEVADLVANLAWDRDALGDAAAARTLYERALAIREATLGPEHPDTAVSLNNLAYLEESQGNHAVARSLYERALTINEKVLGPESPETANSLNNLAGVLCSLAAYGQARPLYERALAIQEMTLGPENTKLAMTLNNLAQLDKTLGAFDAARGRLERSLAIREKNLGPRHPDTALGRNNLAGLLDALGEYDQAKPLYERSLADLETALGPDHPFVAACLINLASVFSSLGDIDAARPLLTRALAIWEKIQGPEGEDVARPLNNLALLHFARSEYGEARVLLDRALAILERNLGSEHPLVASVENALAGVAAARGDLLVAKERNERAWAIRVKVLGPRHLETAISLNNLAGVLADLGERQKAVAGFEQSLSIMEEVLGPRHPFIAKVLDNLARVEAAGGDIPRAFALMRRARDIDAASIEPIMAITSDTQKLTYLATLESNLHDFQSLVAGSLADVPEARQTAFQVWLGRKGIVLEAQRRFQEALFYDADPETAALARELAVVRGGLSRLTFAGPGGLDPAATREAAETLRGRKEALEAALSARAGRFSRERKRAAATVADLAASLPSGSSLVDFCRYETSDFTARKRKTGRFRYLAYVLPAGGADRMVLVDLGDAAAIDQAVNALKATIRNPADRDGREIQHVARALHDLVFAPLREFLGDRRMVFLSPDGNLNLIPFEVLLGPDGRYAIEDFTFNYLSAGRDLLEFAPAEKAGEGVVLFGDPDFNRASENPLVPEPAGAGGERHSRGLDGLRFSRLPGTREEVSALSEILGADTPRVFLEGQADESALERVVAPRILHLATHGFFLGDQLLAALLGPNDDTGVSGTSGAGPLLRSSFENPLLRSGLALAGANKALSARGAHAGQGIVTAEKILALHLQGTEMVVLSACETGLGTVRAGEGVFGLRRAFAQAGVRSLVMSLWSVPDLETRELMVSFYCNLRQSGHNRSEALRRAALEAMGVAKTRYGWPNPFYWGAFVFLGQP